MLTILLLVVILSATDRVMIITAANRVNKSWFLKKYVSSFIILVNILSFHSSDLGQSPSAIGF